MSNTTENFVDYNTECPFCGEEGELNVTKFTLSYHDIETFEGVSIPLESDGFDIYDEVPDEIREDDLSTEDEEVTCNSCGKTFDLSLVMYE